MTIKFEKENIFSAKSYFWYLIGQFHLKDNFLLQVYYIINRDPFFTLP